MVYSSTTNTRLHTISWMPHYHSGMHPQPLPNPHTHITLNMSENRLYVRLFDEDLNRRNSHCLIIGEKRGMGLNGSRSPHGVMSKVEGARTELWCWGTCTEDRSSGKLWPLDAQTIGQRLWSITLPCEASCIIIVQSLVKKTGFAMHQYVFYP